MGVIERREREREEVRRGRDESRATEGKRRRSAPLPTEAEIDHGVPLYLDQLCVELRQGPSKTHEISQSASE